MANINVTLTDVPEAALQSILNAVNAVIDRYYDEKVADDIKTEANLQKKDFRDKNTIELIVK